VTVTLKVTVTSGARETLTELRGWLMSAGDEWASENQMMNSEG